MTHVTPGDGSSVPAAAPAAGEPTALAGPRPAPSVPSLLGAAGGSFLLVGLFLLLGELGDDRRLGGIALSLLFEVLGIVLLQFSKGRRSATAGGTLAGVAIVPLLGFLFIDADTPSNTFENPTDVTGTATSILVIAALIWFCAWFFGPGRRYAFFLGAACIAIWLATQVQLVESPLDQLYGQVERTSTFSPVDPGGSSFDPTYEDDFGTTYEDEFGTTYDDDFGTTYQEDLDAYEGSLGSYEEPDDPSAKLGWSSLLFGVGYLVLAARRDRAGDGRAATALFAASAPILLWAVSYLSGDLGTAGSSFLAIALGGAALWLGTRAERRFTSWAGTLAVIFGVVALVDDALGDSARASALVLVVVGLGLAIAARRIEDADAPPSGPAVPVAPVGAAGGPAPTAGEQAWAPAAPPQPPTPWGAAPATPPAGDPPSPPAWGAPPQFEAPSGWGPSPSTPPAAPSPSGWGPTPTDPPAPTDPPEATDPAPEP